MSSFKPFWQLTEMVMLRFAFAGLIILTLGALCASALAAAGLIPWIGLDLGWNGAALEAGGMYVQLGLTGLLVMLCFLLPAAGRLMRLETSHRRFTLQMEDVAKAYWTAHAADRARTFHASSEFDSVRERLAHLKDHPDLGQLEPDVLEVAAQMSHLSRDLAETYSDDKMARARDFLRQRQQEVELFNERLDEAKAVSVDLRNWRTQVELEESVARAQLDRLRDALSELLPELGVDTPANVSAAPASAPNDRQARPDPAMPRVMPREAHTSAMLRSPGQLLHAPSMRAD